MNDQPARRRIHRQDTRSRRGYHPPAGDVIVHPPQFVPLSAEDERAALAALAELLAPLFRPPADNTNDREGG